MRLGDNVLCYARRLKGSVQQTLLHLPCMSGATSLIWQLLESWARPLKWLLRWSTSNSKQHSL